MPKGTVVGFVGLEAVQRVLFGIEAFRQHPEPLQLLYVCGVGAKSGHIVSLDFVEIPGRGFDSCQQGSIVWIVPVGENGFRFRRRGGFSTDAIATGALGQGSQ